MKKKKKKKKMSKKIKKEQKKEEKVNTPVTTLIWTRSSIGLLFNVLRNQVYSTSIDRDIRIYICMWLT